MMNGAPKESKSAKAARQAEEAKVAQERIRAENSRIEETQDILSSDTLRRIRRFGKSGGGGGLAGALNPGGINSGSQTVGSLNVAPLLMAMGGGATTQRRSGGSGNGSSSRSGGLVALV
jgi:hypothetical protein